WWGWVFVEDPHPVTAGVSFKTGGACVPFRLWVYFLWGFRLWGRGGPKGFFFFLPFGGWKMYPPAPPSIAPTAAPFPPPSNAPANAPMPAPAAVRPTALPLVSWRS